MKIARMRLLMERHPLLLVLSFFFLGLVRGLALTSPELYWKEMLPDTTMPKIIKDYLPQIINDLPPTGTENNLNMGRKGLGLKNVKSLTNNYQYLSLLKYNDDGSLITTKGYGPLLSYNSEGSLTATKGYGPLLGYNSEGSLTGTRSYGSLLSYNNEGSLTDNKGYGPLLGYNSDGSLTSNKGYGPLLGYNSEGSLTDTNSYGSLLSYNNEGSLTANKGYGPLLGYSSEGSLTANKGYGPLLGYSSEGSLTNTKSYGSLLSYNNEGSLTANKGYAPLLGYSSDQGSLTANKGYGPLLGYSSEGSLTANKGYSPLLGYNSEESSTANTNSLKTNKYLRLLSDVKNDLLTSIDGNMEPLSHNQGGYHYKDNIPIMDHFFFLEKDLHLGKNMHLKFNKSTINALFLPREISNSIPFSSNKVQEIMSLLSINPNSMRAHVLKERIALCEQPKVQGIDMQCVTSLESMVDYVISKIGKSVTAKSNTVEKDMEMEFTIEGVTQVSNDNEAVVCHKLDYPYGLFFCHSTVTIKAYIVNLVGQNGTKMEAIAACHKETTKVLEDYAINVLKVKPGSTHICHFPEDAIIWYPN